MLESVDLSRPPLPKEEYKPRRDALMEELVVLQQEAVKKGVGLVVLFEGWNGAGKGSRISDLMYNLDARATSVYVTEDLDVEAARAFAGADQGVTGFFPVMQEFWRALGPRGAMTFYDRGWYTAATQHLLYTEFVALFFSKGWFLVFCIHISIVSVTDRFDQLKNMIFLLKISEDCPVKLQNMI